MREIGAGDGDFGMKTGGGRIGTQLGKCRQTVRKAVALRRRRQPAETPQTPQTPQTPPEKSQ